MIIITGASKNIGRFLFRSLKNEGEKVLGTYNSTIVGFEEDFDDYYKIDLLDDKAIKKWICSIKKYLNNITLISCAGISQACFAHKADIEQWQHVVNVNVFGTFNIIHELLPLMREQSFGRIILMSSVVAKLPTPGVSAYATSKAALLGLTKSLAVENASKGITVNAINLGYVSVGMGVNDVPRPYQEKMKSAIPEGRFCEPFEILNTVKYLMNTPYITGSAIDLNGGVI